MVKVIHTEEAEEEGGKHESWGRAAGLLLLSYRSVRGDAAQHVVSS